MMDIWMSSIARAGGIEVPPDRFVVATAPRPKSTPPESLPKLNTDGRLVKLARWVETHLAPTANHCEV